tara:strand:+ start:3222 stop:11948 length:8727 start_codon:yes stop_codon:yes gene_type:complete
MAEIKNTFLKGKMNKDLDERLVPKGEYIDAMNVEVSTSEGSNVGTVQNILGNYRVAGLPNAEFKCIGSIADEQNNRIYWFVTSTTVDMILEWDDQLQKSTLVFVDPNKRNSNSALNFPNTHVTGINIIDDFLYWTDGIGEPKKINVRLCKLGTDQNQTTGLNKHTTYVTPQNEVTDTLLTEDFITVIKKRPLSSPFVKINHNKNKSEKGIFERVMPRFCFRYKYRDGEYSAFGPFTNVVFSAKHQDGTSASDFYSNKEVYNKSMVNTIKSVELMDFIPADIPADVVQVDLLYKSEGSNVVYSIANIKPSDDEFKADGSTQGVDNLYGAQENNKGRYLVTTENIYAALPENQMLRSWDNVPRKAAAQEMTGNRLVYANYTQGYDMPSSSVKLKSSYEKKSLKNNNALSGGLESVKSLRDYQLGVVYGDKYGRETPVFSSTNASINIPWVGANSDRPNFLSPMVLTSSIKTPTPDWAKYFKFYIKETSGEYYNLLMDKLYIPSISTDFDNKEEHVWLSFPSSEINKITTEDYLTLKKVSSSTDNHVEDANRYKVIDVKPEAPDSVAYVYLPIGEVSNLTASTNLANSDEEGSLFQNADRRIDKEVDVVEIDKSSWITTFGFPTLRGSGNNASTNSGVDNATDHQDLYISWKTVDSSGFEVHSRRYRSVAVQIDSTHYKMKLNQKIHADDAALAANTAAKLNADLVFTVYRKEKRDAEEFSGKFFAKILSDEVIKNNITAIKSNKSISEFVSASKDMFWWADRTGTYEDQGLDNMPSFGQAPDSQPKDEDEISGISNKASEWDALLTDYSKAFFIDNMHMSAANLSSSSYAKEAGQGVVANELTYGKVEWNSEGEEYPWDLNQYTTWSLADTSSYSGWQSKVRSFVPGVLTTTNDQVNGFYRWKNNIFSQETNETYGEEAGGHYMHVSFLAPGKNLFDSSGISLDDIEVTGANGLGKILQGIWGGGAFTNEQGTSLGDNDDGDTVKFVELEGNYVDDEPLGESPSPGVGIGYDLEYKELHERQWDPTFSPTKWTRSSSTQTDKNIEDFVKNLAIGKKFKFEKDSNDVIYTILDISIKHVYNHTPFRSKFVFANADEGGIHRHEDQKSVEECAVEWATAKLENNMDGEDAALLTKLEDFGKASNRRTVFVLKLDKAPQQQTNSPIIGGTSSTMAIDIDTSMKMQFIDDKAQALSGAVKDVSAVFETEPKDSLDLNIFYETGGAIPTELTIDNVSQFAPVGSRIEFIDLPSATRGKDTITDNIYIKSWEHAEGVGLYFNTESENATASSNGLGFNIKNNEDVQIDYVNTRIRFYRPDGSFTACRLGPHYELESDANQRAIFIVNPIIDASLETGLSWYNCFTFGDGIESNRLRDDFNATFIGNGAKASTTLEEPYSEENRKHGLIYSGLYNASSGLNNLNQFIQAEKITKDLNPTYGSIQKLFSRRADLIAFCEDRVVKILANKDALFNADGNTNIVATTNVLGQATPFVGDYGISKNPESFAFESYRAYFTDKQRGAVLRLSMDGLTPISDAGMHDYFRDNLPKSGTLLGTYDEYKRQYNLTLNDYIYNNLIQNSYISEGEELSVSSYVTEIIDNPNLESGIEYTAVDIANIYDSATEGDENLPVVNSSIDSEVTIINWPEIPVGAINQAWDNFSTVVSYNPVYSDVFLPNYGAIMVPGNSSNGGEQYQTNVGATVTTTTEASNPTFGTNPYWMYISQQNDSPFGSTGMGTMGQAGHHATFRRTFNGTDYPAGSGDHVQSSTAYADNSTSTYNTDFTGGSVSISGTIDGNMGAAYNQIASHQGLLTFRENSTGNHPNGLLYYSGTGVNAYDTYYGARKHAFWFPWSSSLGAFPTNYINSAISNANPGFHNLSVLNREEFSVEIKYKVRTMDAFGESLYGAGGGGMTYSIKVQLYDGTTPIKNYTDAAANDEDETYVYNDVTTSDVNVTAQGDFVGLQTTPTPGSLGFQSEPSYTHNGTVGNSAWSAAETRTIKLYYKVASGPKNPLLSSYWSDYNLPLTKVIDQLNVKVEMDTQAGEEYDILFTSLRVQKVFRNGTPGAAEYDQQVAAEAEFAYNDVDAQIYDTSASGVQYGTLAAAQGVTAENLGDFDTGEDEQTSQTAVYGTESTEAVPSSAIPAWAEVVHALPLGYTSSGVTQLNYAALQQYGQENPGTWQTVSITQEGVTNDYQYYTGTDNGVTTYQQHGAGEAYNNHNGADLSSYNIAGTTHHVVDGSIGTLATSISPAGFSVEAELIDGDWYMVDLGYDPDSVTISTPDASNFLRLNGDTVPIIYGCIPSAVGGGDAYQTTPGDANYPDGYFGQMYRYPGATGNTNSSGNVVSIAGGVVCMPTTATEYGEQRPVLRAVFQASSQAYEGLDKVRLSLYNCQAGLVEITDVTVINISQTGNLGGFSEEWSAQTTNNLINALSEPISYYENGGWVWNIPETYNGNGAANRIDYDWSGDELTSATSAGYVLKFGIQPNPDTGTVEGKLYIRMETPELQDGQTRVIRAMVDTAGDYSVFFNLDGSGISSIVQPEGSSASISMSTQPPDIPGIYARPINQDGSTGNVVPNWFVGKIDYLSIIDETSIVSGGVVGSWVFSEIDYEGSEINTLSANNLNNLLFAEEQIKWDEALKGLRVSQAIEQEILVGQKYDVSFNVTSFTSGSIEVAYYASPTAGFAFTVDGNTLNISETVEIQSVDPFDSDQHIIGSLMITSSSEDSLTTMSIDNITMTQIAFPEVAKQTISYSEEVKGWTSFKSFVPESGTSVSKKYFTFKNGEAYQHYHQEATPNTFYNLQSVSSTITTLLNDAPELIKNFKTINYEGSQAHVPNSDTILGVTDSNLHNQFTKLGWKLSSIDTNMESGSIKEFIEKEDKWFNYIKGKGEPKTSDFTFQGIGILSVNPVELVPENIEEE